MYLTPKIGQTVYVLGRSCIFLGIVIERREVETVHGVTERFLVEYADLTTPAGYASDEFVREELEDGYQSLGESWLKASGSAAREFVHRRAMQLQTEQDRVAVAA